MNTDIRISVSLKGHRKRKKLEASIGKGAMGYLIDLWISASISRPDGKLSGMTEEDISLDSGWEGEPNIFINAMLNSGFMEKKKGTFILHDWEEHQSWVVGAPARADRARKAAAMRWACSEHASSNAKTPTEQCPSPILSLPILTKPKSKDKDLPIQPAKKKFSIPSVEDVQKYCDERKNSVDAERFVDYYEANGWKVGKNGMKDWKAAVRTWERNAYGKEQKKSAANPKDDDYYIDHDKYVACSVPFREENPEKWMENYLKLCEEEGWEPSEAKT